MAVSDYSITPGNNSSISGINIAENCPAANLNNAIRQIMADIATYYAANAGGPAPMPISGGAFTGNPTFSGKGGYLYNAGSTSIGGMVSILPTGSSFPASPADGDQVLFYS